jgi:excinuclease ABC subunit C
MISLKEKIKLLPHEPGSYQFLDKNGKIIYVGKAKNLYKRVSSYFVGSHNSKTTRLIMEIDDFKFIVTHSELDALLLELNLIKQHQPRFNIMLMDDKTYPYIMITKEKHPKLIVTRKIKRKNHLLFGPYPNVTSARKTAQILNKIYPFRKCDRLPTKVCLYYHIGQCLGPCIHPIEEDTYKEMIKKVRHFLNGDTKEVIDELNIKMSDASKNLQFEKANEYKLLIQDIETTTSKQHINLNDLKDRDVIGFAYNDYLISIEIFFIRKGAIINRHSELFEYYSNDVFQEVETYINIVYGQFDVPKEIMVDSSIDASLIGSYLNTSVITPQKGDKYKILQLAHKNAKESLQHKTMLKVKEQEKTLGAVHELGKLLNMDTPYMIESFDNSTLFGTHSVAAMVVFKNGVKFKNGYRKYRFDDSFKDDVSMMKSVLYRRYQKVLLEDLEKPDLILLDGGKGQLSTAKLILDELGLTIPVVGMVKNDKHQTSHLIKSDFTEIPIKKNPNVLHLISSIQDEVHRFAITFHKQLRDKGIYDTILDSIPGIGTKTKQRLLNKYKSVKYIKDATKDELEELGLNKTQIENITNFLNKE